jgi:3-hydroxyethyl bacteriochlorophyllide a dehydrogenase
LDTLAIVIEAPGQLALRRLALVERDGSAIGPADILVETEWSAVSTGTEKLLWQGRMPNFPGMGYPLVPGYESVGRVVDAGRDALQLIGQRVFVPGANCYQDARGLFGGAARRLVLPAARVVPVGELGLEAVLLALAATAHHAIVGGALPDLVVGHGILGRLVARLVVAAGGNPTVWEIDSQRTDGARGYTVVHPGADERTDYNTILDVSGDSDLLDTLVGRIAKGGEIVLAGFYKERLDFAFAPAFRKEARIRIAAEFKPDELAFVHGQVASGMLALDGLVSHLRPAGEAEEAYPQAFADSRCLKMVLDWRDI